jgi:D-alanyl-D-alanine carboxypeptidase
MTSRLALLALALAAACASVPGHAPAAEQSSIADRLDRYATPLVEAHELSGSFLVARAGRTLAERSYGMANREHAVPATSDTRYVIGSISKEFTAAAIVLLAQQGRLGLDDHLEKYVPGFPSGDAITLRQMLRHTSGISRDLATLTDAVVPHSTAELVEIIRRLPLASTPGARYGYSNNAYKLLAYVIERVSGESYASYLARSFFEPLGMTSTGELAPLTLVPHLASGYTPGFGPDGFGPAPHLDISNNTGAASLYSTPRDLMTWSERFLLEGFPYPSARDTLLADGGLGVGVATRQGHRVISHDGVWQGYTSFATTYPDEQLTVIYLGNTETAASVSPLQAALDSIAHGADVAPPMVIARGAPIPPDRMSDYVGRYDFFPGLTATIRRMYGTLVLGVGEGEYPLEWVGDDRMFFRLKHATVSFTRAASGRVEALEWREAGNMFPARRVK